MPLSAPARSALDADPSLWTDIVAGGDDYEILFTAPPGTASTLSEVTRIGRIVAGAGVTLRDAAGRNVKAEAAGYRHF